MIVSKKKLEMAMANACLNTQELCKEINMKYQQFYRVANENNCKPATIGKIAKALNVPVETLIED